MQADGPNIRRLRERMGHGLNSFAQRAGISPSHLSRIERGLSGAQPEVIQLIAAELHVEVELIIKEEVEKKS
ncbi:helix-turn-helix transcriptional regulator [Kitasatospora sp. NPDC091276]|uniref:helix-turn-helix domain-containing protein n=1 Tax=unclassified Kitasatospora TaxID=2633591 RepID=UPI00342D982F